MKIFFKLISIISILYFVTSCDDLSSDVSFSSSNSYSVNKVNAPLFFLFAEGDSVLKTSVEFNNSSGISDIWFSVLTSDSKSILKSRVPMADNGNIPVFGDETPGDQVYSGKVSLSKSDPNGEYNIEYFVLNTEGQTQKIAVHKFKYNNSQLNIPPKIENVIAPDTIIVQDPKSVFLVSVAASDSNGFNDIDKVWFTVTRPNGTSSGAKFFMNDAGADGDQVAGDGRYSLTVEVTPGNAKGTYRFDFQAQDRRKELSNIISHNITLL